MDRLGWEDDEDRQTVRELQRMEHEMESQLSRLRMGWGDTDVSSDEEDG